MRLKWQTWLIKSPQLLTYLTQTSLSLCWVDPRVATKKQCCYKHRQRVISILTKILATARPLHFLNLKTPSSIPGNQSLDNNRRLRAVALYWTKVCSETLWLLTILMTRLGVLRTMLEMTSKPTMTSTRSVKDHRLMLVSRLMKKQASPLSWSPLPHKSSSKRKSKMIWTRIKSSWTTRRMTLSKRKRRKRGRRKRGRRKNKNEE